MKISLSDEAMDHLMQAKRQLNLYPKEVINLLLERLSAQEIGEIIDGEKRENCTT